MQLNLNFIVALALGFAATQVTACTSQGGECLCLATGDGCCSGLNCQELTEGSFTCEPANDNG
jgi:hypothetical protein